MLDWLLGCAVRLEYGEKIETFNKVTKKSNTEKEEAPKVVSNNPLDNLDFSSNEFRAGVENLADKLKVNGVLFNCIGTMNLK